MGEQAVNWNGHDKCWPIAAVTVIVDCAYIGDELEYYEDGEDLNFDGVMAEKHRKKLYQVDYTVQSAKHLMGSQDKEVGQVASILGMYLGLFSDTHSPHTRSHCQ